MQLALMTVAAALAAGPADGDPQYHTLNWPLGEVRPYALETGAHANQAALSATVFRESVTVEGSAWMRLYFGKVELGKGSSIRITSLLDGEVQDLDGDALAMWDNSTAYFNGDTVLVELNAGPMTQRNTFAVEKVGVRFDDQAVGQQGECGICGAQDNRVPSSETWTGRMLPAGCTASVIAIDSCMVSAGHCVQGLPTGVVQFNVPNSTPGCSLVSPPVAEQFPYTVSAFNNNGVGDDWSVVTMGTNNLGQRPFDRYGQLRAVSTVNASAGTNTSVTGYGVDTTCTLTQTQRTAQGTICVAQSTFYTMQVDLTGGNSGSALLRVNTNDIIGIVTHCPCCNVATKATNTDFAAARAAACQLAAPTNDVCATPLPITQTMTDFGTFGATTDALPLPPECDEGTGLAFQNDLWYSYTAACTGTAFVNTCFSSNFNARLAAYSGACGGLTLLDCSDDSCGSNPSMQFPIVCDETYLIRVGGNGNVFGVGTINLQCLGDCVKVTPCPWDIDGGGSVDIVDFLDLLGAWGPNPGHPADFDSNGQVDIVDFLKLLGAWGPCPA